MSAFGGIADIDQPFLIDVDTTKAAAAAWRRFVSCVRSLPAEQAMPLWKAALAEAQLATVTISKGEYQVECVAFGTF
jgi:hypothetical protein